MTLADAWAGSPSCRALVLALVLAGCRSMPAQPPSPVGQVDVALVPPPAGATRLQLASSQAFVFPNLVDPVVLPDYPAELLPLRLDPLVLCMDVVISEAGRVSSASRRIDAACPDEAGPHGPRFAEALQQALSQWSYDPALVCRTPDGRASEDACAEPDALETPTALRLSYAFHFSQENGRPSVELRAR